jgi:LysM repeat protein
VRVGDTLLSIARAYNVTLADIYRLNPGIDARVLRVGDLVLLPGGIVPPQPPAGPTIRYTVRAGDSLLSIARAYSVTLADIYRLNPNIDARVLRVGDVVLLPGGIVPPQPPTPPPANVVRYQVRTGDTLYRIATAYGITLADIYRLNPGINPQTLRVGDIVLLPSSSMPQPSPLSPPIRTSVSVEPRRGPVGTVVDLNAAGFPPSVQLRVLAGTSVASLQEFQQVGSDTSGRARAVARIPVWSAGASLLFAYETLDGRLRSISEPFVVTTVAAPPEPQPPAADWLTLTGTLTREGVECQAMRGDDGRLYTLSGADLSGLAAGDRVQVGGYRQTVSTCQQGTTIAVRWIWAAPP